MFLKYSFVFFVIFFASCRSRQLSTDKEQFINHPYLISFQEPVGDEVRKFDFYMLVQHYKAFDTFKIFSFRKAGDRIYSFLKSAPIQNLRVLNNDIEIFDSASYNTSFRSIRPSDFIRLKTLLSNSKIDSLNDTEGKMKTMIDGEFYDVFIYSNDKAVQIKRYGSIEEIEDQVSLLIKFVKDSYYNNF